MKWYHGMLDKKNRMIHFLSLGVLCIGFVLCRYVCFDFGIHGMKEWPEVLFGLGIIAVAVSFIRKGKIAPVCTAFSYMAGFIAGVIFQTEGEDPGGGTTNNLWFIWTVVFVCFILAGMISDQLIRSSTGERDKSGEEKGSGG